MPRTLLVCRGVQEHRQRIRGELTLIDEIRYFCYIITRRDLRATEAVRLVNVRGLRQEHVVAQLHSGVNAFGVPIYDLMGDCTYMVMALPAWNLRSWFAMMLHLKAERRK